MCGVAAHNNKNYLKIRSDEFDPNSSRSEASSSILASNQIRSDEFDPIHLPVILPVYTLSIEGDRIV